MKAVNRRMNKGIDLFYGQPRAMSRSLQIKIAREPQTDQLGDGTRWRSGSGVARGCVNRIRLWPLKCDDHSGLLIAAGGTRHYDWPARV